MTDCDRALELISAGLDGVLTPEEKDWLEKHLEHCPACRALDADLASLHQLLPTLAPEPPAELKERIMDAVRAEKTVPFPAQGQKKPRRWKAWVSVAAVAALVFLGGRAALPALNSGGASLPAAAGLLTSLFLVYHNSGQSTISEAEVSRPAGAAPRRPLPGPPCIPRTAAVLPFGQTPAKARLCPPEQSASA